MKSICLPSTLATGEIVAPLLSPRVVAVSFTEQHHTLQASYILSMVAGYRLVFGCAALIYPCRMLRRRLVLLLALACKTIINS